MGGSSETRRSLAARIDWPLFILYVILVLVGVAAVYSVEYTSFSQPFFDFSKSHMKQLTWFGISLFIGLIILFTDGKFFFSTSYLFYLFGILLLLATFVLGSDVKGSHSFIRLGSLTFQPGELCKVFTALALARFLSSDEINFKRLKYRLFATALVMLPLFIILAQNETGLALVYFAFFLPMYREGLPGWLLFAAVAGIVLLISALLVQQWPLFFILTGIAVLIIFLGRTQIKRNPFFLILVIGLWGFSVLFTQFVVPFTFKHVFHSYQVERIYSMFGQGVPDEFMKPGEEHKGFGDYNVRQSKIAIGSGGLLGKGFMNGTQTKYSFVPEQNTDFVFCGIGEQFGFVGSAGLVLIYLLLLLRIAQIAERQRSSFSRVYAYCVGAIIFFHLAINISMTMGIAPVIGITLPMLSYGGTSLLSFSIMFFILLRLDADRQVYIH